MKTTETARVSRTLYVLAAVVAALALAATCTLDVLADGASTDRNTAAVVPIPNEPAAKLVVDDPLADQLVHGRVVIPYRAENLRIIPVFGSAALDVSPRVGHIHVTVDDASWHWADASGEPVIMNGFSAGPHKVLIELVDANHKTLDKKTVNFVVPEGMQSGIHH